MKTQFLAALSTCVFLAASTARADTDSSIPSYYSHLRFNLTSPAAFSTAIGGYHNPAVYGTLRGGEAIFSWTDYGNDFSNMKEWGLFFGGTGAGFGVVRNRIPLPGGGEAGVNDLRFGLSGGERNTTVGFGFGWSTGDKDLVGRSAVFQAGLVHRFGRYASLGLSGNFATRNANQSGLADVAVRPFGNQTLTVFADGELPKGVAAEDAPWSVGAMVEPVPGLQLVGRYFDDESYSIGVGLMFGGVRLRGTPNYDKYNNTTNTTYEIRSGFGQRSAFDEMLTRDRVYLSMNLKGNVRYRGYRYFDNNTHPFYRILTDLEHAKNDPAVKGVAINIGGMEVSRGKAWEIREKLKELQAAGKHVVIFAENMGMTEYHLASVADRVVLDPEGMVIIPGYVMGRTFVKDLLGKLGVGFDEWRFFKYKSAAEMFSRTSMSEADREQRYDLIEDLYATVRSDVSASRHVSPETFDEWVNEKTFMSAIEAKQLGLVDDLGRWEDVEDVITKLEGSKKHYVPREMLAGNRNRSTLWGEDPQIAIVYALGGCDMDSGINARRLEKVFQRLRDDKAVKAIVFRIDSPGGSSMAADMVAVQVKKCAEKKPVIISQGDVAASGGYWLSMYGTKIYALPGTISGSIGVIGGWIWDDGLGEKTGHTSDFVKVGEKTDYGFGIRLLLSAPPLPRRNLDPEDRAHVEREMKTFYGYFLDKVAEGRGIARDRVDDVAQGHVFSGIDAIPAKLVDQIGGLDAAIHAAMESAGLDDNDGVEVVEYPTLPFFNFDDLNPSPFGFFRWGRRSAGDGDPSLEWKLFDNPEWYYVRLLADNPGRPLVVLPPDYYVDEAKLHWR